MTFYGPGTFCAAYFLAIATFDRMPGGGGAARTFCAAYFLAIATLGPGAAGVIAQC
jgi:hypothetical protein